MEMDQFDRKTRMKEISRRLSHTLDCLGYGQHMIRLRQEFYWKYDEKERLEIKNHVKYRYFRRRIVGSRSEGSVKSEESDIDCLVFNYLHTCIDETVPLSSVRISPGGYIYRMVPCVFHPGHYKLYPAEEEKQHHINTSHSRNFLSSKNFIKRYNPSEETVSGPAITKVFGNVSGDLTRTMPCFCFSVLGRWFNRCRKHDWPSEELRKTIALMCGNIVAKGISGCDDEHIEWRLCFNESELLLVQSWNDTQAKLYKILKMIKKDILKPKHSEITSYILKNIVFWLSETYPQSAFQPSNLFLWVIKALRLLKRSIKCRYLPYYMIPERNLLVERIQKSEKKRLVNQIVGILNSGPQLLHQCEKISFSMEMTKSELEEFGRKCNYFECISMQFDLLKSVLNSKFLCKEKEMFLKVVVDDLERIRNDLVLSEWPSAVQERLDSFTALDGKMIYLSS